MSQNPTASDPLAAPSPSPSPSSETEMGTETGMGAEAEAAGLPDLPEAALAPDAPMLPGESHLELDTHDIVFREGEAPEAAYLVVSGRIGLARLTETGRLPIGEVGPGQIFGEMSLIDGATRSAMATALEPTRLRRLPPEAFFQRLERDGSRFGLPILRRLGEQLRATSDRMVESQISALHAARRLEEERLALEGDANDGKGKAGKAGKAGKGGGARPITKDPDLLDFLPEAERLRHRPVPRLARLLFGLLALVLVGAILAACLVRVDRTVIAPGKLITAVPRLVVQPVETAVVRDIHVRAGQRVTAGTALVTLDNSVAEASLVASQAALTSLEAAITRLEAELFGRPIPDSFSPDPAENALQRRIDTLRRREQAARLDAAFARLEASRAETAQTEDQIKALAAEIKVARALEAARKKLYDQKYGPRDAYLSARNQRLRLEQQQEQLSGRLDSLRQQQAVLAAEADSYLSDRRAALGDRLDSLRRERDKLQEALRKRRRAASLVSLTAPADGIVLEMAEMAVGSVVQRAQPLVTLVPAGAPLEAELEVETRQVGRIQPGDPVRLRIDSLAFQRHGSLNGRVRVIGEDTIDKKIRGQKVPVYRLRVAIEGQAAQGTPQEHAPQEDDTATDPQGLHDLPEGFVLSPGMTVTGDIRIGTRPLISYFLYPILREFTPAEG